MAERPRGRASSGRSTALARADTSRRGFLARVGRGADGGDRRRASSSKAVKPGEADAYHFCGHTFTTGSCPHPTGRLPRIDAHGFPLRGTRRRARSTTSGAPINGRGEPVDDDGDVLRDPDGRPLPPAPRTKVCDEIGERSYGFKHHGRRRLVPLLRRHGPQARRLLLVLAEADQRRRGAEGYCYAGRKVFCVMYFQTKVPC